MARSNAEGLEIRIEDLPRSIGIGFYVAPGTLRLHVDRCMRPEGYGYRRGGFNSNPEKPFVAGRVKLFEYLWGFNCRFTFRTREGYF
jgi:hypothetical protein